MAGRIAWSMVVMLAASIFSAATRPAAAQGSRNVYYSVQLEWCQTLANEHVNVSLSPRGVALVK